MCALVGSVFIQIGTNLANDYSDARRGADTEDRLGPVRVTAGGLMPPRRVLVGTWVAFGIAVAAGAYLIAVAGWQLLLVGAASIAAGVLYTGGPRPYGYEGLGELFVFLFFGVVAVVGSYYVQVERLEWEAFALAVPVGLLAAAILVVNNVRDIGHRPPRRQADAGGEARAPAHAAALRGDAAPRLPRPDRDLGRRRPLGDDPGRAPRRPSRAAARAHGRHPHRRRVAQRRARRAPGGCWPCSRCCCRPGILLS